MKILVLLSAYNGEKYIREQLDSLFRQTLSGVEILVRDDGSKDGTRDILEEYSRSGKLNWYAGENIGCEESFWHLLQNSGDADYYAFCDQDDIWDPDKIETAVRQLENRDHAKPLLYMGDVRVTDADMHVIAGHMSDIMPVDYPHSLIKNICPGCTYLFNRRAMELLRDYDSSKYKVDLHDWVTYRIIVCFGEVVFDAVPHMSYRQHGNNVIGATEHGLRAGFAAYRRFSNGRMTNSRQRNAQQMALAFGSRMTPENRRITELFARYREDPELKRELLTSPALRFKGIKYLYFIGMVLLNKL